MKLEMVCIQLCQGAVSVGCTDKPYIVDSVPDHMVVVAFQKLAAFIPVVVQKPWANLFIIIIFENHSSIPMKHDRNCNSCYLHLQSQPLPKKEQYQSHTRNTP